MREQERQRPQLPQPAPQAVPQKPLEIQKSDLRVVIKAFKIVGNSLIAEPVLQGALADWIGKEAGYADLQSMLNAIAEEYRKRGWFVRPQLPEQDITDGIITINILEGRIGTIQIDDQGQGLRISRNYITEVMSARQKPGDPLNLDDLDRSINLLNDTPGVSVATVLTPGNSNGESDAIVKVQDKPLISGMIQMDNQGARSTGENKLTLNSTIDNPFGIGDQIQFNGNTTQGNDYLKLGYTRPVGHDGLRVGVNSSAMQYRLIGDLASLKAKGDAQTFGVNASYPLLRSGMKNVYLSTAIDRKYYHNEANQTTTSDKRISAAVVSLSGDALDGLGAGGMTLWSFTGTAGNLDLSATPTNQQADKAGPKAEGNYTKLAYSLSRLQRMTDKATFWASANGQWAGKNLDSSEKMSLGGPFGVRAYPVIEGLGDDGWLATAEARYNVLPSVQATAFYDHGWIRQSHNPAYVGSPMVNDGALKGAGVGLNWSLPGNFVLKAVWAHRIGINPFANVLTGKDTDGSLDKNRLWLTLSVPFDFGGLAKLASAKASSGAEAASLPSASATPDLKAAAPMPVPSVASTPMAPVDPTPAIRATLASWQQAWSERNVQGYLAQYAADFVPNTGVSQKEWVAQRTARLTAPAWVKVEIADPEIRVLGDQATVAFVQRYRSDRHADTVRKTLTLKRIGEHWRIVAEQA